MAIDKRKFLVYGSASLGTAMLLKACGTNAPTTTAPTTTPAAAGGTIKVGILHSIFLLPEDVNSGTMAISEQSVVDADLLAIEEINKSGGVLGKQIEAIVEDVTTNYLIGSGAFATLFKSVTPLYDFFTFFATTSMAKVMLFALIVIFLQYKPAGIFPQKGRSVEI